MQLGGQLFKAHAHVHTEKYKQLDLDADTEEEVDPNIGKVTGEYRDILKYAPKWTTWPDFEQVRWMNSTIEWLWPNLARAIVKMVRRFRFLVTRCVPRWACVSTMRSKALPVCRPPTL